MLPLLLISRDEDQLIMSIQPPVDSVIECRTECAFGVILSFKFANRTLFPDRCEIKAGAIHRGRGSPHGFPFRALRRKVSNAVTIPLIEDAAQMVGSSSPTVTGYCCPEGYNVAWVILVYMLPGLVPVL